MPTYRDLYDDHLRDLSEQGGTSEELDQLVDEVNAVGEQHYRPSPRFLAWVTVFSFKCSECGEPLPVPTDPPPPITADVLCVNCAGIK